MLQVQNTSSTTEKKMTDLPPEIMVTGVLSRLPVKSLLRFRCVSKLWCAEIDSPYFINLHLKVSTAAESNLSLFTGRQIKPDRGHGPRVLFTMNSNSEVTEVEIPFVNFEDRIHVWGSCNGLLLLQARTSSCKNSLFLFNPSTRKHVLLPDLQKRFEDSIDGRYFLVYDAMNDDYKVLSLLPQRSFLDHWSTWIATKARVYSVKSNSWFTIKNFKDTVMDLENYGGIAYVNGALHSINETRDPVTSDIVVREIVSTDIESGARRVMPLPESIGKLDFCYMMHTLVGGCLCVLTESSRFWYNPKSVNMWVMKEYGVRESWSMLLSVAYPKFSFFQTQLIFYSKSCNEVLLHHDDYDYGGQLVWRNLETGTTRNFLRKAFPFAPVELYVCVESLVSVCIL